MEENYCFYHIRADNIKAATETTFVACQLS